MKKLVTISRQFGSGGRIIGKLVSEKLGVEFYDKEIITLAAEESGLAPDIIEGEELRAKNGFTYGLSSAMGMVDSGLSHSVGINEKIYLAQHRVIEDIGKTGNGVIVGRCADFVLRDIPEVTKVFIYGDKADRVRRVVEEYGHTPSDAEELVRTYDKARENYYNYHTDFKWGNFKTYNMAINSSYIDYEDAANLIIQYIEKRRK